MSAEVDTVRTFDAQVSAAHSSATSKTFDKDLNDVKSIGEVIKPLALVDVLLKRSPSYKYGLDERKKIDTPHLLSTIIPTIRTQQRRSLFPQKRKDSDSSTQGQTDPLVPSIAKAFQSISEGGANAQIGDSSTHPLPTFSLVERFRVFSLVKHAQHQPIPAISLAERARHDPDFSQVPHKKTEDRGRKGLFESPTLVFSKPQVSHKLEDSDTMMSSQQSSLEYQQPIRRSRSIAIKQNKNLPSIQEYEATSSHESEKMYDWATWRMYNRIVDYRKSQKGGFQGPMQFPMDNSNAFANTRRAMISATTDRLSPDFLHDGEVFQLEI
jgi:hypothetical protein